MVSYCEEADVRKALQKPSSSFGSGALASEYVQAAIEGASGWFARSTNGHWYDSGGSSSDLVDTSANSATNVRLDVPSSPHRTDRQIISDKAGARYPFTRAGPYARVLLPHLFVTTLNKLEVRDTGGGITDWVADSDFVEGRGEDYYIEQPGQGSYGRTYLYIRAASIGTRIDFTELLTLDYDYGLDAQTTQWDDVKRGIANLAAAEVADDDDVLAQVPDNGQLIGIQTQHQNLLDASSKRLDPYISTVA